MKLNSYRRPLGERGSVLLVEEVEQLVLLVQGHHLTHGLIVLLFLLQSLTHNWIWKKKKKMQQETGCYNFVIPPFHFRSEIFKHAAEHLLTFW